MTTSDDKSPLPSRGPRRSSQPLPPSDLDELESTFRPTPAPSRGSSPTPRKPKSAATGSDPDPINPARSDSRSSGARSRRELPPGRPPFFERVFFGSVRSTDLAIFCRQLGSYLDAGVDLLKSLGALEKQFRKTALGSVIGRLQLAIRRGDSFSEALDREPRAFDRLMRRMMRVAEARGGMPEVLRQLAGHFENRVRLFRKARSAMIYPTAVILIASAVGYLLTVFVLPSLVAMLQDLSKNPAQLPGPTRALMALSHFMQTVGWFLLPLAGVGGFFAAIRAYRTSAGKNLMDRFALRVPVLGTLMRTLDTTRFARTLSTLLEAGVDYDSSLRLTSEVLHATPYQEVVDRARTEVLAGTELSEALDRTGRFDVDVIQVLNSGEETGKLPEALAHLADDYEERAERMIDNLGQLVQPVLTVLIGGFVFFIALAFIMAYVSAISGLTSGL